MTPPKTPTTTMLYLLVTFRVAFVQIEQGIGPTKLPQTCIRCRGRGVVVHGPFDVLRDWCTDFVMLGELCRCGAGVRVGAP